MQQLWENNGRRHHIIIQNSPRTGKFGSENDKDIICSHGYKPNEQPSVAVDKISQYFTAKLTDLKIPHSFYNFAFKLNAEGKIESNSSVYNQLLYLSQTNPNNYFIVPCESMSMLSQIPLYLNPDQVIAFHPSSENAQHTGIFNEAFKRGHLCQFDEKHEVSRPENLVKLLSDDAQDVASSLLKFLGAEKSLCLER